VVAKAAKDRAKAGETGIVSAPARRGPYGSDQMSERRQRLLDAALALLLEGRADGFTVREVTQRAAASVTVLYSVYGSKEGLIAAAIQHFYVQQEAAQHSASRDLDGVLFEIEGAAQVTLSHPPYVRSLCDLYFSHAPNNEIYEVIGDIARDTFLPWLDRVMGEGGTLPGLTRETISGILAGNRWHVISDWARGRIPDGDFAETVKLTFLLIASGMTVGDTRREVDAALRTVSERLAPTA
jgi:TetR/AcrR family transcriptional regulator, cholesterol catabolism regulator